MEDLEDLIDETLSPEMKYRIVDRMVKVLFTINQVGELE